MLLLTLVVLAALALFAALRMLLAKRPLNIRQFFLIYAGVIAGSVLIYLGLTGRLHWLFALIGAALSGLGFIGRIAAGMAVQNLLRRAFGAAQMGIPKPDTTGQKSDFATGWVRMVLDHDTGNIDGEVLQGPHAGAQLSQLELNDVLGVLRSAAHDPDTVQVMEAYLDRMHDGWRDQVGDSHSTAGDAAPASGPMSRSEALDILGLDDAASDDEVVEAHKRLIQKLHPDRGGSTFLAAKINQAKDLLLKR